jgi:AraC-like DNA-binding protein
MLKDGRQREVWEKAREKLVKSALPSDRTPISIYAYRAGGQTVPEYEMHQFCEMGIVLKGRLERIYLGENEVLTAGGIWWNGSWEPHGWKHLSACEVVVIEFMPRFIYVLQAPSHFYSLIYLPFLRPEMRRRLQPQTRQEKSEVIARARALVREWVKREAEWPTALQCQVYQLLLSLARRRMEVFLDLHAAHLAPDRLFPALDYIQQNMALKLSLAQAAEKACLGRTQFAKVFRQTMGVNFARYVWQSRLERARYELLTQNAKISYIAAKWGFSDSSHFCRQYTRYFGRPPGQEKRIAS